MDEASRRLHRLPLGPRVVPATKVDPPRLRSGMIRRARLTDPLREQRPTLTLLVAPPGFGKTSLLADWAGADPRTFAWLRADRQDNDPALLWAGIGAAIGVALDDPELGDSLSRLGNRPDAAAAAAAELAVVDRELVLCIDDYHLVESEFSHVSLFELAELAPPNVRLALATRSEPPMPIARLRAQDELIEVRARELAFSLEESAAFLNEALELELEPRFVRILHQRTQGWPAGLYLAYLSLRAAPNAAEFIETFGASNRHVGDFLTEQVLLALDPETLDFLLDTAITDTICGPLGDAIRATTGSAERLAEVERANVFIVPLDERREWYRYHPLFAELLQLELARRHPERRPILHERAARWYAEQGDADSAVRHAVGAGNEDLAATFIATHYLEWLERGRLSSIVRWLEALGPERVRADRRLAIVQAWTMHFLGRHAEGEAALAAARALPDEGPLPDGAISIESSAALIWAGFPGGDVGRMLVSARRAFELEGARDSPWRATVHVQLGFALVRAGRYEEARHPLVRAVALAHDAGMVMDEVAALALLARVECEIGAAATAEDYGRAALDRATAAGITKTPAYAFAQAALASALIRSGDPAEGERLVLEALPTLRAVGEPLNIAELLIWLAQARRALGNRQEANLASREADSIIAVARDPGILGVARHRRPPVPARALEPLSPRELEVLAAMAGGASKRDAAKALFVTYNTVHSHVRSIYRKLDVHNMDDAVARARNDGRLR
jgi:LuxR family maltose regulon positive regulatory protein